MFLPPFFKISKSPVQLVSNTLILLPFLSLLSEGNCCVGSSYFKEIQGINTH